MDIEKLVKKLKKARADGSWNTLADLARTTAEALTALKSKNEKLRDELEKVKREKSALKNFYREVVSTPDCNTCKNKDCIYRPKPGEITRFNCPLWRGVKGENNG